MSALSYLTQGDAVHLGVSWVLLAMSVASWVMIVWKGWLLARANRQVGQAIAAFWQAGDADQGSRAAQALDPSGITQPFFASVSIANFSIPAGAEEPISSLPAKSALAHKAGARHHLTRTLRGALHTASGQLTSGMVLLATIGATAPFVGLLGTVWGIHEALVLMSSGTANEALSIERIAGPVGEALVMTAAGLAVALPAVMAYNLLGRRVERIEAVLEGLAQDLLDWAAPTSTGSAATGERSDTAQAEALHAAVTHTGSGPLLRS